MDSITFRGVHPDRDDGFFDVYRAVRTIELGMQNWEPLLREQMLRFQLDAQRRAYREQFPAADERVILRDGSPIGWVIVERRADALHGIDIALVPEERQRGVGTAVIQALQAEAGSGAMPMVITVQRLNVRAIALYRRLGFQTRSESDLLTVMEWRAEGDGKRDH